VGIAWGKLAQLCINHKLPPARRKALAGKKRKFIAEAGEIFERGAKNLHGQGRKLWRKGGTRGCGEQ